MKRTSSWLYNLALNTGINFSWWTHETRWSFHLTANTYVRGIFGDLNWNNKNSTNKSDLEKYVTYKRGRKKGPASSYKNPGYIDKSFGDFLESPDVCRTSNLFHSGIVRCQRDIIPRYLPLCYYISYFIAFRTSLK